MELTGILTWHDPRTCTPEQFGGPLPIELTPNSADELADICASVGSHTLLDVPLVAPALTWCDHNGLVQLVPDFDRGIVEVRSGGHTVVVGARPVRPIDIGRAIFDVLGREPVSESVFDETEELVPYFCGNPVMDLRRQYGNAADHPLTGTAATEIAQEFWNE